MTETPGTGQKGTVTAIDRGVPDKDRVRIGGRLILAAWGVEIVAALIGLLLAAVTMLTAVGRLESEKGDLSTSDWSNALLGSLPFVIVAIVELTKIPLATATYVSRSIGWRIVFGFGLALLMLITAETVYNGFERQFTVRNSVIQLEKNEIATREEQIDALEKRNAELSATTRQSIQDDFLAAITTIGEQEEQQRLKLAKDEQNLIFQYGGERAKILQDKLENAETQLQNYRTESTSERQRINAKYDEFLQGAASNVESEANRLEENLASIDAQISRVRDQLNNQSTQDVDVSDVDAQTSEQLKALERRFEQQRSKVSADVDKKRSALDDQIAKIDQQVASIESSKVEEEDRFITDDNKVALYSQQIDELRSEQQRLLREKQGLTESDLLAQIDLQQSSEHERILDRDEQLKSKRRSDAASGADPLRQSLQRLEAERRQLSQQLGGTTTSSRTREIEAERNSELEELDQRYANLIAEQNEIVEASRSELLELASVNQDALAPLREEIQESRDALTRNSNEQRRIAEEDRTRRLSELVNSESIIAENERRVAVLRDEIVERRERIATEAQESQIYRVAALMFSENPADVTNAELRVVSVAWFGSLAIIVAWTGTLLAFGGLVAKYGRRSSNKPGPLIRAFRSWLIDRRRASRVPRTVYIEKPYPQEVIKEVPVEKVVLRDVPRNIVTKEMVHVPFFTDDPDLLAQQTISSADLANWHQQPGYSKSGQGRKDYRTNSGKSSADKKDAKSGGDAS